MAKVGSSSFFAQTHFLSQIKSLALENCALTLYTQNPFCRGGGMADTEDLNCLSTPEGNAGVNGVKVGEPLTV